MHYLNEIAEFSVLSTRLGVVSLIATLHFHKNVNQRDERDFTNGQYIPDQCAMHSFQRSNQTVHKST